jgi:serine/threonine protein kinase
MPVPTTADDFLALVRKSGLVEPSALEAFERGFPIDPPSEPKRLAKVMVREGVLTRLQAGQLLRGKWRAFVIGGKYKLLEHLGTGGMGQVYLCEHIRMGRQVAIKILPPDKAGDKICLDRFFREAKAAAALDHPNIVRAHDIDHDRSGPDPLHFLVMEYVDGNNLQFIVDKFGRLSIERACHYIAQTADALQHAHEAGLVHRDIKPANLLLDRSGLIKVLDLGLARFFFDAGDNLTRQLGKHTIIGTADYLAPEQASDGHTADIRADIYSLGVTFYFFLTGRSPYKEGTIAQKLLYHRLQQPEPIKNVRPEVPDGIARIIDRMLAKDPSARYLEPIAVRRALDLWTSRPIPPPPETEMPRLSRAARRPEPPTGATSRGSRSTLHNLPMPVGAEVSIPTAQAGGHGLASRIRNIGFRACGRAKDGCRAASVRVASWFRRKPKDLP